MYPYIGVHLSIRRGTVKVINKRENILIDYLYPNIYTYISEYSFQKSLYAYCLFLNISTISHDEIFGRKSIK